MGLDTRYVPFDVLQEYFPDKDSGFPLSAGIVSFFSDVNRTTPKNVFIISGTPPNYTYTNIGAVITLSAVGTFSYLGNDIMPYLFPYDDAGNIELYYITCTSASPGLVPQFVRQGWPNLAATDAGGESIKNYIPNGQFLIHTDIPNGGLITQDVTVLAQGGWSFVRSPGSTATDLVTFERIDAPTDNPSANPRYRLRVNTQIPDVGDTVKDVRVKFRDVNKFASEDQVYTFSFTGNTNTGSPAVATLNLVKNYGTSGSTPTTTVIDTVSIQASSMIYNIPFTFGTNDGKTIGPGDDDYVEIALTYPLTIASDIEVVDWMLSPGNNIISEFPQTTNSEFLYQAVAGWMPTPAHDNSDVYLPLRLTPTGMEFDHSDIGKIFAAMYATPAIGELECDGASYLTSGISSDTIPYSRLQAKLFNNTTKLPLFGTGAANLSSYLADVSPATNLRISTNQPSGSITNASNGAVSPGFTVNTIHAAGNYSEQAYMNGTNSFIVVATIAGAVTAPTAGTSGFTITDLINQSGRNHLFQVSTIAAAGLAGLYFTFVNTTTTYYVWYTVDSTGADPAPGGTGIKVDLLSTYTAAEVAKITREAISGFQQTTVITVAASAIPVGSYFNINTFATSYYVWYKKGGSGSDPKPSGKTGILVSLAGTETAAQVAAATQLAINSMWFATPLLNQGMFLRGIDPNSLTDYDSASRYSLLSNLSGDNLGTFEIDAYLSHSHALMVKNSPGDTETLDTTLVFGAIAHSTTGSPNSYMYKSSPPDTSLGFGSIALSGGTETRPVNAYVNYVIKY